MDPRFFVNPSAFKDPMTGGKRPHELLEDGLMQMQGGARTTIEAGAAALLHPKDAIDELKSMFNHVGQIFSSTDIGGNIRIHLLPAVQILIKYLPLGGAPGYAAAVALERLLPRAGKIIELIASIMDFFTGRKDFFQMLSAFKEMVEDLWHQFMDIVPKVTGLISHAVSEAIGSNDTTATLSNMLLGTNYESPAVKRARLDWEAEKSRVAAADEARDAENTRRVAAQAEEHRKYEADVKEKRKKDAIVEQIKTLGYSDAQATSFEDQANGKQLTDPELITPNTLEDMELIQHVVSGANPGPDYNQADFQTTYNDLFKKAMDSHKSLDKLWAAAKNPALNKETRDKYYEVMKALPNGMKFLADHGVKEAQAVQRMAERTPEIWARIDAIKDIVRQGNLVDDEDKQFMADQGEPLTGGGKRRR